MIETKKSKKSNLETKRNLFFLIGLVLALGSVLCAFEWKTNTTTKIQVNSGSDFIPEDYVFIPSTPAEKLKPPKPMIKVPNFILVDNDREVEDVDILFSEIDDVDDIDFSQLIFQPTENPNDKEEEILVIAEVMPEFPGGERALINYLSKNVRYPVIAQENGVGGKVYISFVVDEQGDILDVKVLRGVDAALDNEALRVVKGMPRWSPGKQGGKPVKVRYNVPIYFELR